MAEAVANWGSRGAIAFGPAKDPLVAKTISFVYGQLAPWRDSPARRAVAAEKKLNNQLCTHLARRARTELPMVTFTSEAPQGIVHTVDIGAYPDESIDAEGYNAFEPFLVIECKRLPAPAKSREREYVTGIENPSGALQRLRLGLHGATVSTAIVVGYIQQGTPEGWFDTINAWIAALAQEISPRCACSWTTADLLSGFEHDEATGVALSLSQHLRPDGGAGTSIGVFHLWVVMSVSSLTDG